MKSNLQLFTSLIVLIFSINFLFPNCITNVNYKISHKNVINKDSIPEILCGDEQTELYFPILKNKKVAIVCNQSSVIKKLIYWIY